MHGGFIGEGYGIPSIEAADAIRLVARTEGPLLDPTYTVVRRWPVYSTVCGASDQ